MPVFDIDSLPLLKLKHVTRELEVILDFCTSNSAKANGAVEMDAATNKRAPKILPLLLKYNFMQKC
jgi:hypothetical protein